VGAIPGHHDRPDKSGPRGRIEPPDVPRHVLKGLKAATVGRKEGDLEVSEL